MGTCTDACIACISGIVWFGDFNVYRHSACQRMCAMYQSRHVRGTKNCFETHFSVALAVSLCSWTRLGCATGPTIVSGFCRLHTSCASVGGT